MKRRSISKEREILNTITTLVAEYGKVDAKKLILELLALENPETGYKFTIADIARKLDKTPQAIHDKYPDLKKEVKS